IEAKLKPTSADITEWLARSSATPDRQARMVYSSRTPPIAVLQKLIDLATFEAADFDEFRVLVTNISGTDALFRRCDERTHMQLRRVSLEEVPEAVLKRTNEFLARGLADEHGGQLLIDFLYRRLAQAISRRHRIAVSDLINPHFRFDG